MNTHGRFWSKVEAKTAGECWTWLGARSHGYGRYKAHTGITLAAHRVAWELSFGPIPRGLNVCHRCDNPPCVNPNHLFLGTQCENLRDCAVKGRARAPRGERNGRAKLMRSEVVEIRSSCGVTQQALAVRFGVSRTTISYVMSGRRWADGK